MPVDPDLRHDIQQRADHDHIRIKQRRFSTAGCYAEITEQAKPEQDRGDDCISLKSLRRCLCRDDIRPGRPFFISGGDWRSTLQAMRSVFRNLSIAVRAINESHILNSFHVL